MILLVRGLARGATLVAAFSLMLVGAARARTTHGRAHAHVHAHAPRAPEAHVPPGLRVSVQPISGELGPVLRDQIARLLRSRGCRVVMSLPRVAGTGQYLTLATDNRVAAFVAADIQEGHSRPTVTLLVWHG